MPSSARTPACDFAPSRLSDSFAASIALSAVTSRKALSALLPASMAERQASVSSVALISFARKLAHASEMVSSFNDMDYSITLGTRKKPSSDLGAFLTISAGPAAVGDNVGAHPELRGARMRHRLNVIGRDRVQLLDPGQNAVQLAFKALRFLRRDFEARQMGDPLYRRLVDLCFCHGCL